MGGFRKGFMAKVTQEVLSGGWREFPQMVVGNQVRRVLHTGLARTRQSSVIAGELILSGPSLDILSQLI